MPEPTDQTSPSDAGHTTTEYRLTRAIVVALGILAGGTVTFAALHQAMPDVGWISVAFTLVTSIGAAAVLGVRYLSQRSDVKVALANLEAARTLAAGRPLPGDASAMLSAAGRAALAAGAGSTAAALNPELQEKVFRNP